MCPPQNQAHYPRSIRRTRPRRTNKRSQIVLMIATISVKWYRQNGTNGCGSTIYRRVHTVTGRWGVKGLDVEVIGASTCASAKRASADHGPAIGHRQSSSVRHLDPTSWPIMNHHPSSSIFAHHHHQSSPSIRLYFGVNAFAIMNHHLPSSMLENHQSITIHQSQHNNQNIRSKTNVNKNHRSGHTNMWRPWDGGFRLPTTYVHHAEPRLCKQKNIRNYIYSYCLTTRSIQRNLLLLHSSVLTASPSPSPPSVGHQKQVNVLATRGAGAGAQHPALGGGGVPWV